ncbi:MAG TPA: hypothetical protein VHL79_00560, partial [Ramlibacter sp.]|nr:hypothetical protein [Ramlibacter sp.]
MIRFMLTAVALAVSGAALAKLPPLDEAAKAKAAETAARSAWQSKVDAFQLCKAQDRVVAYVKSRPAAKPAAAAAVTPVAVTAATAAVPTTGTMPAAAAAATTPSAAPAAAAAAKTTPT